MPINIHVPKSVILKPVITVFGIGGAGGNAINNMIQSKLAGVNFVAANTDAQALSLSLAEKKIQLGEKLTKGLGAGANPKIGASAAEETINEIRQHIDGCNMVVITAGMGGGTGTGAAPIIARIAKEMGKEILVVGVVTKPFNFEGVHRMKLAVHGIEELEKYVDTLVVIPNQNLISVSNNKTTFVEAFKMADNVLYSGIRGITDLMIMPGLVNLDFADIQAVMNEMGKAMMGSGEAEGEDRAIKAAEAAIANPLLEHSSMKGARGVLMNITGGSDMTLFEVDEAANRIRSEIENDNANIIFGSTFNEDLNGKMRVSVVATGINAPHVSKKSMLQNFATLSEEKFDLIIDESLSSVDDAPVESVSDYMDEDNKKGIFGSFVRKLLGKPKRPAPLKLKSEPIELQDEFFQKGIYDKPALLRKEEKASEIS